MRLPFASIALASAALVSGLTGCCNCSAIVNIENRTSTTYEILMSLPYPGQQWFTAHCWYRFEMKPGTTWSSEHAIAGDGSSNPINGIHGGTVMHVENLSNGASETWFVPIDQRQQGTVVISADGDATRVTAHDSNGVALEVKPETHLGFGSKPGTR